MKKLLLLIIFAISTFSYSQENLQINWETDVEYIRTELPERHKDLFFKRSKIEFENGLNEIVGKKDELSDFEIALKLQQIFASMGDSHTTVYWFKYVDRGKILPIKLYWFSDGIYIIKATEKYKSLLGKKIIAINDHNISEIADSLSTLITIDNQAIIKNNIPELIPVSQILDFFGISDTGFYKFEVESLQGERTSHKIIPNKINKQDLLNAKSDSIAFCWKNTKIPFIETFIENDSIYYIQYNHCSNRLVYLKYSPSPGPLLVFS